MAPTAAARWEQGVGLGARGRYAEAAAVLTELIDTRDRWSSLALSTLASHRRQVGDAIGAAARDTEALACATDAESRAEALIGLAADAVASADETRASAWHVQGGADAALDWRTLTRWHWVGAELAMLTGDPAPAVEHARCALAECSDRSPRHAAKSRIVLAAVTGDAADLPAVGEVLRAEGWVTLEWPLSLVAGDHAAQVPAAWLSEAWHTGRAATYAIEEGLPPGLRDLWRAHPGVGRLRDEEPPAGGE